MDVNSIRHYDGLVNARGGLTRAIRHCSDKKVLKMLKKIHLKLTKRIEKLRKV